MKLVIIEPLGVEEEKLMEIAHKALPDSVEIVSYQTKVTDTESLIERGKDADIIMVANLPLNAEVIKGCKNLKMLAVAFTGIDHIAMDACKEQGITVCNCAGYSNAAVSDLVFGLLISLYRNIISCDQVVREEGTKDGLVGFELEGKKFGVIGKDEIALMKPDAVLINTARGPVVDSEALAEALNNGKIAGAAVDVFENEPPVSKDHPLLHAKNLIATPHVAFATKEALVKRAIIDFDNVKCWMEGKPVNVMN